MKKLLLAVSMIAVMNIAKADVVVQTSPPKKTPPTVQLPPSDPNAGDASAYTLPGDGLTSSADNAASGRRYQEKIKANKILNPQEPVPDQNSY